MDTGLIEYSPGVYSNPAAEQKPDEKAAYRVARTIKKVAAIDSVSAFNELVDIVKKRVEGQPSRGSTQQQNRSLTPLAQITATNTVIDIPRPHMSAVRIWVSFDPEWIFPNDNRLWTFLVECANHNAHPVVFVRKIAPSTFPLFKALGIFGVQYYAWIVPDGTTQTIYRDTDKAGFPPLRTLALLGNGEPYEHLDRAVDGRPQEDVGSIFHQAVVDAKSCGLIQPETATLDGLLNWAEASTEIRLPDSWRKGIEQSTSPDRLDRTVRAPMRRRTHDDTREDQVGSEEKPTGIPGFGRRTTVTRVPLPFR